MQWLFWVVYQNYTFGAHFLHDFSIKMFFDTPFMDKASMPYLFFPSQDIKQNVLLSFCLNNSWRHIL